MERWEDWEGATVFSNKQGGCQQLDHDKSWYHWGFQHISPQKRATVLQHT
jgi:hypothetical protein